MTSNLDEKEIISGLRSKSEEVEKFAYDFLDGALDPKTTRRVERHLKTCKNCQRFILSYKKTVELGQTAPQTPLPDEFKESIFQFLVKKTAIEV